MREGPKPEIYSSHDGITLLEATSKRQEALAIAPRLRQAVETGKSTLITPDREISLRIFNHGALGNHPR